MRSTWTRPKLARNRKHKRTRSRFSLRDLKFHLARFLVDHGADVDATLRVVRLDLPSVHESTEDEERVVDEDGDATWFRRLVAAFCEEQVAKALERLRAAIEATFGEAA
jgi:hypothetical protein